MQPFSGLLAKLIILLWLLWCDHQIWILHLLMFSFTRHIPTNWIFACPASQPLSIMDSLKGSDLGLCWLSLSERAARDLPLQILRRYCCCPLDWRLCWALLVPMLPVLLREYPKLLEGLPCVWRYLPGILVPAFSYFRLMAKKVSWDGFLTLTTGLPRWLSLLVLCEEREINVEVKEERFSTVLSLIITELPCHVCHIVTLQIAIHSVLKAWARYPKN